MPSLNDGRNMNFSEETTRIEFFQLLLDFSV